jgi:hypothetical protein
VPIHLACPAAYRGQILYRKEIYMNKIFLGLLWGAAFCLFAAGCGDSGPQVNLALNKPAVASSFEKGTRHNGNKDLIPASAFDGDTLTRWGSDFHNDADPNAAWIYVDLEKETTIHSVNIYWEAAFAKRFGIEVSDDSKTWMDVAEGGMTPTEFRENGGFVEVKLDKPVEARYVKLNGKQRESRYGYSIYEIEVY